MPRGRKLDTLWDVDGEWRAARNGSGLWVVVNERGEEILQQADTIRRMQAVHLAAQAPTLRGVLASVLKRLSVTLATHGSYYGRDVVMVREAEIELSRTRVPFMVWKDELARGGVQELPLESERAGRAEPRRLRARGVV